MRTRAQASIALGVTVVAMLGPPLRHPPRDSFPLSTYPMFSHDRGRLSTLATVVGVASDGRQVRLSPRLIGGTDEVMLAVETARHAVDAGAQSSGQLCQQVAGRVAGRGPDDVRAVRVVVETYDAISYFTHHDRVPRAADVRAECAVPR